MQAMNVTIGTAGGTLLVLLFQMNSADIVTSAILAAVGTTVSFGISVLLKCLMRKISRK
jgi:hypothetical protein